MRIPLKVVWQTVSHYRRWPHYISTFVVFSTWSPLTTYTPSIIMYVFTVIGTIIQYRRIIANDIQFPWFQQNSSQRPRRRRRIPSPRHRLSLRLHERQDQFPGWLCDRRSDLLPGYPDRGTEGTAACRQMGSLGALDGCEQLCCRVSSGA